MFTSKDVSVKAMIDVVMASVIKTRGIRVRQLTTHNAHNNNGGAWSSGRIFVNGRKNLWRISNF